MSPTGETTHADPDDDRRGHDHGAAPLGDDLLHRPSLDLLPAALEPPASPHRDANGGTETDPLGHDCRAPVAGRRRLGQVVGDATDRSGCHRRTRRLDRRPTHRGLAASPLPGKPRTERAASADRRTHAHAKLEIRKLSLKPEGKVDVADVDPAILGINEALSNARVKLAEVAAAAEENWNALPDQLEDAVADVNEKSESLSDEDQGEPASAPG
jgi:hypothetical protein